MVIHLRRILTLLLLLSTGTAVFAQGTRTWEQSKFEELVKGTTHGVAIRSAGGLELAPAFKALATTPSTYIWSIASDRDGTLYAAAGSPARVYRITSDGATTVIFEPQELQVQALVVDNSGAIYAATNPDGKIYKLEHHPGPSASAKSSSAKPSSDKPASDKNAALDSGWSSSVCFNPETKYIWDLALDGAGNLYAATGDQGQIFQVTPKGEHSVFFKSDEAHIRVLIMDANGNLIAGSDGSGLVYRITPNREGFVLYSAPKKEITALAIDKDGNIYAAGVGEKRPGAAANFPTIPISIPVAIPVPAGQTGANPPGSAPAAASQAIINFPNPGAGAAGGSEVYRITPDGSPSRIWSSKEDLVYALGFDQHGRLLAGTGNRGHIFAISSEDQFIDLLKASATQVTAFAAAPGGGLYASTSNLGKLFLLSATPAAEGSYESDVFDAHIFSRWGRVEFRGKGSVDLFVRSGNVDNPDRNWSEWKSVDPQKDVPASVPSARFVQWRAVLHNGDSAPRVDSVSLNYLPKNVAPDFDDVTVQSGVRYQSLPKISGGEPGAATPHFDSPPPTSRDRGSIGVKWSVHDENDDQMVYSVYYRGESETRWLLLKDDLSDKYYSFDASLLPDGGYTVKVVASDAPSHSPGQALTEERESARFEVDTTPPQVTGLRANLAGAHIRVTFGAADNFSPIKRAEYSLDAGDWQLVEPIGQLSDSKTENYDFEVRLPAESAAGTGKATAGQLEHVVVVRVYDRYENMSSAKTVIRGK